MVATIRYLDIFKIAERLVHNRIDVVIDPQLPPW